MFCFSRRAGRRAGRRAVGRPSRWPSGCRAVGPAVGSGGAVALAVVVRRAVSVFVLLFTFLEKVKSNCVLFSGRRVVVGWRSRSVVPSVGPAWRRVPGRASLVGVAAGRDVA